MNKIIAKIGVPYTFVLRFFTRQKKTAEASPLPDSEKQQENELLLSEIRDVCRRIQAVQSNFQMIQDEDLTESCIYQLESLYAHYRFLLKKAKAIGMTAQPFLRLPSEASEEERRKQAV